MEIDIGAILKDFGLPMTALILIMKGWLVPGREYDRALERIAKLQERVETLEGERTETLNLAGRMMTHIERRE